MDNKRRDFIKNSAIAGAGLLVMPSVVFAGESSFIEDAIVKEDLFLLDMVHHNPGETKTESKFTDPAFLKSYGYGAKVFFLFEAAQFGIDWNTLDRAVFPTDSDGEKWIAEKKAILNREYNKTKQVGLSVYCMLDMLVFPTALVEKHKTEMCNSAGKIDITKPFTQQAVKSLLEQMFDTYPQLDGLVIRTGETYLQDAPHHTGGSPVVNGLADHVVLLNILREVVCVQRNKKLFYRTWDISRFHPLPKHYLEVTNQVSAHDNLYFSIKHTIVDFWRMGVDSNRPAWGSFDSFWIDEASKYGVPFNPCLGIGKHKQIVEVQCQREYEGKASHPNYIAKGVIDRFKELENLPSPQCLNEFKKSGLFAGVWTWSRGGGWGGPYTKYELWPELNAYVMAQWAKHPAKTEKDIFKGFCKMKGVPETQVDDFHKLCLLSADGVFKGNYSAMGNVFINWTRDDKAFGLHFLESSFKHIVEQNKVDAYLAEKEEAASIWNEIRLLSGKILFANAEETTFLKASCEYGFLKYSFFAAAWNVLLRYYEQNYRGKTDYEQLRSYIKDYDDKWNKWKIFTEINAYSPTLYSLEADFFGNKVGLKDTVDKIRVLVE
ncbi:twin-arginine translocation signal domain-containing protein [Flavobacterium psychrotrophum]|uniref:twin-arginine translocation signal domain-containing protein n=1 Tax=Flavobacterium psychrotrophum TaxID=2294119 RepID=UPI0013C4970C|nr:twin-arginine translocation signal domain-containing protein [Flavobacterium psychrotrophum]